jgi:hypothetical protein
MAKQKVKIVIVAYNEELDSVLSVEGDLPTIDKRPTVEVYVNETKELLSQHGLEVSPETGVSFLGVVFYIKNFRQEIAEGYACVNVCGTLKEGSAAWVPVNSLEEVYDGRGAFIYKLLHGKALFLSVQLNAEEIVEWTSRSSVLMARPLRAEHLRTLVHPVDFDNVVMGLA